MHLLFRMCFWGLWHDCTSELPLKLHVLYGWCIWPVSARCFASSFLRVLLALLCKAMSLNDAFPFSLDKFKFCDITCSTLLYYHFYCWNSVLQGGNPHQVSLEITVNRYFSRQGNPFQPANNSITVLGKTHEMPNRRTIKLHSSRTASHCSKLQLVIYQQKL